MLILAFMDGVEWKCFDPFGRGLVIGNYDICTLVSTRVRIEN